MKSFQEILQELQDSKRAVNLGNIDDNVVFDGAVRIYNSLLINESNKQKKEEANTVPLTEKQAQLLTKLGYKGKKDLSKAQANQEIKKLIEKE